MFIGSGASAATNTKRQRSTKNSRPASGSMGKHQNRASENQLATELVPHNRTTVASTAFVHRLRRLMNASSKAHAVPGARSMYVHDSVAGPKTINQQQPSSTRLCT